MTAPRTHKRAALAQPVPNQYAGGSRPKALTLEKSRAVRRAREHVGATQECFAEQHGRSREAVRSWEDAESSLAPNLIDIMIGPRESSRVLLERGSEPHNLEVLEREAVVHGDDHRARFSAVARACSNLVRAVAATVGAEPTAEQLDLWQREATTCAETAREVRAFAIAARRRLRDGSDV